MRNTATLMVALALVTGCGEYRANEPGSLELLAKGLNEAWPQPSWVAQMTMSLARKSGREFLHCRLQNVSAAPLELDSSALPWLTPGMFDFRAITAQGKIVYRTGYMGGIRNSPKPVLIASGQALEGDLDVMSTTLGKINRGEDLLLLWSHRVTSNLIGGAALSGAIFLPKH